MRFSYNEEDSDWWWRSTEHQDQFVKPQHLLPSMPEVSIDDANKVIIANMEKGGTLDSESQLPNPDGGKTKECKDSTLFFFFFRRILKPLKCDECALICINKERTHSRVSL